MQEKPHDINLIAMALIVKEMRASGSAPWSMLSHVFPTRDQLAWRQAVALLEYDHTFSTSRTSTGGKNVSFSVRLNSRYDPAAIILIKLCYALTLGRYRPTFEEAERALQAETIQRIF